MKILEYINKTVYENLEEILQKLDDRLDLKLYAFVLDKNSNCVDTVRVKSVLSDRPVQETEIIQEKLGGPEEVFKKLGLVHKNRDTDIREILIQLDTSSFKSSLGPERRSAESNASESEAGMEDNEDLPIANQKDTWNIYYSNKFKREIKDELLTIHYILSIEYTDSVTQSIYLERPQLSFLRMILDYYFGDYYRVSDDHALLWVNDDNKIETKYKENSSQYLQRMARLFFGKLQDFIVNGVDLGSVSSEDMEITETERNQYYINNLLEKIDGISTRTYEGESPFGCMLLLNTELLKDSTFVDYSIRFQDQKPIYLEDARRIRKLLELTNNESDLYLIADETAVYGVGKIDWSKLGGRLLFKVEFKGLSRYDLLLVTTEKKPPTDAHVVAGVESRVFRMTINLEIVSYKLTSISFKHPGIGSGGFTPALFERIMRAQFKNADVTNDQIEKLRLIIQKATEQRSGTMVVITDPKTAENELKKLGKQSTPIMPIEISPAFIKHLTSIDGAIYFDTTGACHAIGVILDGLAQDHNLGDASRGARFHSAHRYLEKLKSEPEAKGCVIAIISEDGMINLIPEQANEAVVRQQVRAMIGYITENDELIQENLQKFESRLALAESETAIDHHHYFKIAEAFFAKYHFLNAIHYYDKGLKTCGHFILRYNRALAHSYLKQGFSDKTSEGKLQSYKNVVEQYEIIFKMAIDSEVVHEDYNRRALALVGIGRLSGQNKKADYFNNALIDYNKAIEMKTGAKDVLYRNRGYLFVEMGKLPEALNDYISSELDFSEERTIRWIEKLIKKDVSLFLHALATYSEKQNEKQSSEALTKLLTEHGALLAEEHLEVATALEQYGMDQEQQDDE